MRIEEIYSQDQKNTKDWEKKYTDEEFYKLNRELRNELKKHLSRNLTGKQLWMAGMVYHHGFTITSSKKALGLAKKSLKKGYKPAKTLIAQSTDRLLQLQGKPQKFGTQVVKLKNGKWKMYRLDGTITDKDREEHGLPPLKILKRYIES